MKSWQKAVTPYYLILLLCLLLTTQAVQAQAASGKKKIGVIVVLTGPVATVGVSIKNAIILAKAKFDPTNSIEFLFEDDQFQAKNAVTAAEKFINQDKVDALITFSGAPSAAVSQIAERRKVPLVAVTALASIGKSKSYVYSIYLGLDEQMTLLAEATKRAGYQRIGMITTIHDAMLGFRKAFIEKESSRIFGDEEINPGETNISSVATRLVAQKPDAIVLFLLPPQISVASRTLRDQGFQGQFVGGPPLFNPPEFKAAHGALVGAWLPGPDSKNSAEFLAAYQERFNEPCISEGLYGYDAASLLIEAAKSGDVAKDLASRKSFQGLLGVYPRDDDNLFRVPAELKKIGEDGSLQKVE